ncbi:glycerol-3-phosphate dehydrogenase/oxidase [Falsarthrobacter nasiphocae]|uniref:Glycerol-3-phosphate dehydrogenase n=1 Tax=Falsarthrobacter nasiphocae TaxID=189863 RepID=A0AAE3YFR8_9MICC|nr:glycerol-3-phosphate dehydrogenase/oxidase [Falsarthrobacter nasiphocae]MDR6892998.1 glycerol-3-phosphate dehydrogenase [Falsarthrobacter nasiphocae]
MSVTSQIRARVASLRERPNATVLIIGGGINGVGTFRDLALQGIDVALIEREDYCSGASGASSHMIHGGIRYLENGEFRLVKESVVERNNLLKIAPHYVKPLQTTIPIFSTFSGILNAPLRFLTHKSGAPQERGAALIKAGLSIYDSFSRIGGSVPKHEFLGAEKSRELFPQMRDDVRYTATYFDASVHNPERLTLDVLNDGLATGDKARASNYVTAVGFSDAGVRLKDEISGEEFDFKADVVLNVSGAWTDQTNEAMDDETRYMGGTKGSHIVLDHPELLAATRGREIFFEHTDGRIVLIYPMGDRVLVGTTDLDDDMREQAVCTDEEIEYFFELVKHVFPSIPVTRDQIVYTFSGVRPLPRHDDTAPGFVSRDYRFEKRDQHGAKVISVVGGKWTTFRALSEHLTNDVLELLGKEREVSTLGMYIGGGEGFPANEQAVRAWIAARADDTIGADRYAVLLERYGLRADTVADYLRAEKDELIAGSPELSVRELDFLLEHEQVEHVADILIRRTSLAFRGLATGDMLEAILDAFAAAKGLSEAEKDAERAHVLDVFSERHRIDLETGALA